MRIRANIWHLIGRLNQTAADGFLSLRAFKPSSSDSADRGRSIIRVSRPDVKWHLYILPGDFLCGPKLIAQFRYPAEWTGVNVPVVFRMKIKISKSRLSLLISGIMCLNLLKNKIFKIKIWSSRFWKYMKNISNIFSA